MTRNVAVFTGTRAEYGLLYWLMKDIQSCQDLSLQVIVGGMHLSPEFGETWKHIEADGFPIDAKVEMLLSSDSPVGVAKSIGLGTIGFADALERLRPEVLVVLGDRFEALAIVQAALVMRIPVAHLHGGEVTEGAYDDAIRHAITKMSYLHFVAAEPYRQRVIQMGESPDRVLNVGALGLDHLLRSQRMPLTNLADSLGISLDSPFFLVTYHSATLADEDTEESARAVLNALDQFPSHQVILTFPNADNGGRAIISLLERYVAGSGGRAVAVPSLGFVRYLSAMANAAAVIGNSSSGIIEAPSFGVPTVNIGTRQAGRLCASSILHCSTEREAIVKTIRKAISPSFATSCRGVENPYGNGDAARRIVSVLSAYKFESQKRFFDQVSR